jgi:hypothetical protein
VNYVQVTGAATTGLPQISAQGSDTNPGLLYITKGIGEHRFASNGSAANIQFRVRHTASAANYGTVTGATAGTAPAFAVEGSDTNISQVFQSKGTGAIDLAAGSSGVNISNGGTVTALTRTSGGVSYTSFPSVAISAPTTAGGVQALATVTRMFNSTPTIQSGGTGYTVGDVLTIVGGTPVTVAGTYTVATVSAGVITSVTNTLLQAYTALPTSPVSVTGGTGTGATLNVTYQVDPGGLTIGTAGSGYVEQPTVTFSGGGGSGAAAFATVGAGTIIRSLGQTGTSSLSFFVPSGEVLRLRDTGSSGAYMLLNNTSSGSNFLVQGTANAFLSFNSNGTSNIDFGTNGNTGNTQFRVTHTASAVNYVQVTGAATGGRPTISAQGSDTNIDLSLTPKGTGNVRFGTFTSSILTPTGYVEIKDAGGTIRRLLVG